ncbi:MAG: glycoside hydrolase family 13 protein, partial [Eubacteriales bacterium]|nr:glycoside hydrolase family 13 protein [Eubacteriales bacterium]
LNEDWENGVPEYAENNGGFLKNNTVFGGDLYGVAEKLDYIKSLGTELIYLSPIFDAYSNHKYDTGDYMKVDPSFGGDEALEYLVSEAKKRGIGIILDGVFNHTGDDSVYFNRYGNYPDTGAYQSEKSPYYNWYTFRHFPDDYECWWNIKILPRVRCDEPSYREFICGEGGVIEKWMRKGIRGFRLDVADELSDGFICEIRETMKREAPDSVLYGEVWENASNKVSYGVRREYFRGKELDSVMNYPLRKAVIEYLKSGDYGTFRALLNDVYGTYPPFAVRLLMNFLGTHDTERIMTALAGAPSDGKTNRELATLKMTSEERERGTKLVRLAFAIVFTVPGIPCVFYGDEAGMEGYHDPFNRRPFPWGRENCEISDFIRALSVIRAENDAFADGDFLIREANADFAVLERKNKGGGVMTFVNRSEKEFTVCFDCPVNDLLNGERTAEKRIEPLSCAIVSFDGDLPEYETYQSEK